MERERGVEPAVVRGGHDGGLAGLDRVERGEPARAAGQHHAGQVVVGEDERLLERPRRRDVARGAHLVERRALPDGDEPVEEAERGSAREDLDAGGADAVGERAGAGVLAFVEQRAARLDVLVAEHDVGAQLRRAQRGGQAGDAAADDEHVAVAPAVLGPPPAVVLLLGQHAEAGDAAQHLLVHAATAAAAG